MPKLLQCGVHPFSHKKSSLGQFPGFLSQPVSWFLFNRYTGFLVFISQVSYSSAFGFLISQYSRFLLASIPVSRCSSYAGFLLTFSPHLLFTSISAFHQLYVRVQYHGFSLDNSVPIPCWPVPPPFHCSCAHLVSAEHHRCSRSNWPSLGRAG